MKTNCEIVVGVDLGHTGGIAFFDAVSTELLSVYAMPTKTEMVNKKEKTVLDVDKLFYILEIPKVHKDRAVVIFEDVHSFGKSNFSMDVIMEQKGVLRGLIKGFGYESYTVSPKTWQKHFGIVPPKGMKSKEARKKYLKDNSRRVAQENFPEFAQSIELKGSHGLSDACLIGLWYLKT